MTDGGRYSRRDFVKRSAAAGAGLTLSELLFLPAWHLQAQEAVVVPDPLATYPDRGWETVYRNIWDEDDTFSFLCAPNDTHNCLLRASVKNGVVTKINPTYGFGKATDLHGNQASHRWDPRACQKGLALARKFYGDRRVKGPMIRRGFKEWADAGFPRGDDGQPKMDRNKRGEDEWLSIGWDEAMSIAAKTMKDVAETYTGEEGTKKLEAQGYDADMISHMEGAGIKTIKVRGGMPLLGITRIFGFNRFANMLALLDDHIRKVGPEEAKGCRVWDSYTWHTDLPPGHPMVTGQQTIEHDLFAAEYADLIVTFGMNWISTKMPDGHWLAEARMRGTKVITVATDYQSTSNRADEVVMIRPGTDSALALGLIKAVLDDGAYDEEQVKRYTDLPLLVRMDNGTLLRAADFVPDHRPTHLKNYITMLEEGELPPPPFEQNSVYVQKAFREEWGDFAVWDRDAGAPRVVTRDEVGDLFDAKGVALDGTFTVTTTDGKDVEVRTVFSGIKQYLDDNFDARTTAEVTWVPEEAIASLARQISSNRGKTLLVHGMGPNHFFNADLKDRAILLLASITDNIGQIGGNAGSYAGNYRGALFPGEPQYTLEDPFDLELDPTIPARPVYRYKAESAHYYNYGDRPLRVGNKNFTGETHMPSPTKVAYFGNSNSLLGNTKWHYDVVHNTLPKIEAIFVNEWWWTASCEYADMVFGVDSWAEFQYPDASASISNPFLYIFPRSPLPRIHDTRSDIEVHAGISKALGELTGDDRFVKHWQWVWDGKVENYLQRIFNAGSTTRGYDVLDLEAKAKRGIPALMNYRTYPRQVGWEQRNENRPWYNRTGRMEFYRDEPEWLEYGENLPVHREPVDATPYDPNNILGKPHPMIDPAPPEAYDIDPDDRSSETRQVRNIQRSWDELKVTKHPLSEDDPNYKFVFITPKYRHGTHTTPVDLDWISMLFGPFGDIYRLDPRNPWVGEGYLELNPRDAKEVGIDDGDYVWFDADPEDRPYRGAKDSDEFFKVARCMSRARYNNAIQPGVVRMWFNMYVATKGSVKGMEERADGLARNPDTNYQASFRHGSHQSGTRAWLRPTLMTDSMTRKPYFGQTLDKGFEPDVHATNGAPKESFIKLEKAEEGGLHGEGLWLPADEGYRPSYESETMAKYLQGGFIDVEGGSGDGSGSAGGGS